MKREVVYLSNGKKVILVLSLLFVFNFSIAQTIKENKPKPAKLLPKGIIQTKQNVPNPTLQNLLNYDVTPNTHERNLKIINDDLQRMNPNIFKDLESKDEYDKGLTNYIRSCYWKAFNKIKEMLEGNAPLNLKQAVFEVEHAFNNTFTFDDFNNQIEELLYIAKYINDQPLNNTAVNLSIIKAMSQSNTVPVPGKETTHTSQPFSYDFNDPYGDRDYNNMFVSKLLATNKGQCHSMPLLYLILAEELGAEAYLSFSPNHSFIKFKDERGTIYNYETTQGKLVSDDWVMASGYVNVNAIKNGVFLDTLNKKQVIANCLNDLAIGYTKIFGLSSDTAFIKDCTDLSLKHYLAKNAMAQVLKSNMYLVQFLKLKNKYQDKSHDELMELEDAKYFWDNHNRLYSLIQNSGYRTMPRDLYSKWLDLANDPQKQVKEQSLIKR